MVTGLRSVAEHAAAIEALIPTTSVELVPLTEADGRVLAGDLVAGADLPSFANSAMDGYAVRAADLAAGPATLVVSQDIPAGRTDVTPLEPGTAARIMTGAPMPPGADAVVQVEHTDGGTETVSLPGGVDPGRSVRPAGSDVVAGTIVLPAGTILGPPQIGLAAALGAAELSVHRRLRVLVLSTGTELVEPGNPLLPGQIHNSNAYMLVAALAAIGADPKPARLVADDVEAFRAALDTAAADVDLVLTSGGVSAGAYEVVKDAFTGHGVDFVKVAMQPGMPQGCGAVAVGERTVPVVTLPGNPVSSFVSFEVFVRPAVLGAMGVPPGRRRRPRSYLPLTEAITSIPGKAQYRRGIVDEDHRGVTPFGGASSHLLAWLAGADCLFVVPAEVAELPAGAEVEVWDLR